jgi:hypothetical protein
MATLTVTSKSQVTLGEDILTHLGVEPGDKVSVDLLPDGTATLTAFKRKKGLDRFFGMLHDPNQPALSIDEINDIIADGWAGILNKDDPKA